jgi:hypothetical protein
MANATTTLATRLFEWKEQQMLNKNAQSIHDAHAAFPDIKIQDLKSSLPEGVVL